MKKSIGIKVKNTPKKTCNDANCPYHGTISLHGRVFTGEVISDKMHNTVIVAWQRRIKIPKYERYAKRFSKIKAHNPECIDAKVGNKVKVMETRPISKTKNFVVIEVLNDNKNEGNKK
jgi:small subunit ribosomal protein S17